MAGGNLDSVRRSASRSIEAPDLRERDDDPSAELDEAVWPLHSPVTPLGIQGLHIWLLDKAQQLIKCDTRLSKNDMVLLFGGSTWLTENFPQYREKKSESKGPPTFEVVGFDQKYSSEGLVTACHRKGIFSPSGRVFGRGAHAAHLRSNFANQLVLHMGRRVLISGAADKKGKPAPIEDKPAGEIDGGFFPAYAALPRPADEASTPKDAQDLLTIFGKWFWVEKQAAPLLLLGMCAQMHICGALSWRSHAWLAAPTASGKSSLLNLIRAIHADWCLHVEDCSEAAIRQILGDDTLPVIIDEAEADDNPDKQRAIMNLAKKASSGAKIIRGGADHKGQEFTAQSCFLFASVLHSLVKGEERNRMAILQMLPVPSDAEYDAPDFERWQKIGRRMHRRMIEQWPRYARTLSEYKREIWTHGLEGRWQDTFGTLLACADCLLYDHAPSQQPFHDNPGDAQFADWGPTNRKERWVRMILPLMRLGKAEARTDVERCIAYLLGSLLPGDHGRSAEAVGQWIMTAMTPVDGEDSDKYWENARKKLKTYGLRVVALQDDEPKMDGELPPGEHGWERGYLAVAYSTCRPLADMFRGTEWANGNWLQSLGKVTGVRTSGKVRFGGPNPENCIFVPLKALRGEE